MNNTKPKDAFTLARMFVAGYGPVNLEQIADWLYEQCQTYGQCPSCDNLEGADDAARTFVMYELDSGRLETDGEGYYSFPPSSPPNNPLLPTFLNNNL